MLLQGEAHHFDRGAVAVATVATVSRSASSQDANDQIVSRADLSLRNRPVGPDQQPDGLVGVARDVRCHRRPQRQWAGPLPRRGEGGAVPGQSVTDIALPFATSFAIPIAIACARPLLPPPRRRRRGEQPVQHGLEHLPSGSTGAGDGDPLVAADGIVDVDLAGSRRRIQPGHDAEGVIGERSAGVQRVEEERRHGGR